jgi:hypothetical protein
MKEGWRRAAGGRPSPRRSSSLPWLGGSFSLVWLHVHWEHFGRPRGPRSAARGAWFGMIERHVGQRLRTCGLLAFRLGCIPDQAHSLAYPASPIRDASPIRPILGFHHKNGRP